MKRIPLLVLALLLLAGCAAPAAPQPPAEGICTLTFLTVGKGDAFLLTAPQGQHYLVDTGKDEDYPHIARSLRVRDIEALDGIFLTHGHKDHAGCLRPLLEAFPTDAVYISGRDTVTYQEIDPRAIVPGFDTELVELEGGEVLELGGVSARVWLPDFVDTRKENNNSLILKLTHGEISFLLMGDAELPEEQALMQSGMELEADVLKLGHHGKPDATSPAFLDRVRPRYALIAGNAREDPDTVDPGIAAALERRGIRACYSQGEDLDFLSDGLSLEVQPHPGRELPKGPALSFREVDRKTDTVTVRNDGDSTADLSGCSIISLRGDEIFIFPRGTSLAPGRTLTVVCQDSGVDGDLIWPQDSVWKKKGDDALLFDRNLNLLDRDPGG